VSACLNDCLCFPVIVVLSYLRHTLDQYVENDYTLVYFHHGLDRRSKPSFAWLRQAYGEFDRKLVNFVFCVTLFLLYVIACLPTFCV